MQEPAGPDPHKVIQRYMQLTANLQAQVVSLECENERLQEIAGSAQPVKEGVPE